MFKRPLFWLGLLLGGLASFRSLGRLAAGPQAQSSPDFFALIDDPMIICDASGRLVHANADASALFGPECAGLNRLCYSTGQTIPPGQLPLNRALKTRQKVTEAGSRLTAAEGSLRILNVTARPLPEGGAAAVFRDITAQQEGRRREEQTQKQQQVVTDLCRRLTQAVTIEETARVIVESVGLLFEDEQAQVRLYSYNSAAQTLTRLASQPEDPPKRPKTAASALPPFFPFDAQTPALWQVYVARQPVVNGVPLLDEFPAQFSLALPLVSGGTAIGHLSLASDADALGDAALRDALEIAAGVAALALAGPQATEMRRDLKAKTNALREIAQAIAGRMQQAQLAELVTGHVRQITGCALCTISFAVDGKLVLAGEAYKDDLVFPERYLPRDPVLHGKAGPKAWRTQKTVSQTGLANPSYEAGSWRAFAGRSGLHSVVAVPLPRRLGVLTVYTNGAVPLPETQISFLETVAALLGASIPEVPSSS